LHQDGGSIAFAVEQVAGWFSEPAPNELFLGCFDHVPDITRISGQNAPSFSEALASGSNGVAYERNIVEGVWSDWQELPPPAEVSCITDIGAAASPTGVYYRFVIDAGVVYESHALGSSPDSFSDWSEVGTTGGLDVSALDVGGRKWVLSLTAEGQPLVATQQPAEEGDEFAAFRVLGNSAPNLRTLDAALLLDESIEAVGVDLDGTLWRLQDAQNSEATWQSVGEVGQSDAVLRVSASVFNGTPTWLGVTNDGAVVFRGTGETDWWQLLPL
jgi:hypothetical protein